MGTFFEILIAGEERSYSEQAARAAFGEVDRLERNFSRFDPASEIGRANRLRPGEELRIGFETFACLTLAEEARRETGGAFDVNVRRVAMASPIRHSGDGPAQAFEVAEVSGGFVLRRPLLDGRGYSGLDLDLGGVGKGYALDRALAILKEWSVENALLHAGTSTALATGSAPEEFLAESGDEDDVGEEMNSIPDEGTPAAGANMKILGWPVGIGGGWPGAPRRALLAGRALSGSGTEVKGQHVVDPRTGLPACGHLAAWASHPLAAVSDALSTAFLVLTSAEVEAFCGGRLEVGACCVAGYGDVRVFNPSPLGLRQDSQ
jgi:thiamine biosynthesis lipoprotein